MNSCNVLLELHVPDFKAAQSFYARLGFELRWMEQDYMVLGLGKSLLHFYGGSGSVHQHSFFGRFSKSTPRGYGVEIIIFVEDVESIYSQFQEGVEVVSRLRERPWGSSDFRLVDPFGYYLRISESYDSSHTATDATEHWRRVHDISVD